MNKSMVCLVAVMLVCLAAGPAAARDLTLDERVADATALERLQWERRVWPVANPQPKPAFADAVPAETIRARVEDILRESEALALRYGRVVTEEDLRLELWRMSRDTKDSEALRRMFAALGNDSVRVAESIARPTIVDRLLRSAFENDPRIHASVRDQAQNSVALASGDPRMRPAGARYREWTFRRGAQTTAPPVVGMSGEEWDRLVLSLGRGHLGGARPGHIGEPSSRESVALALVRLPLGKWSAPVDQGPAWISWKLLEKGDSLIRIATASWPKQDFATWWAKARGDFAPTAPRSSFSGSLPQPRADGPCATDTWSPMDPNLPGSRVNHTAIWTGTEMIVWGGIEGARLGDGWRYNPATDVWTRISDLNVPSGRYQHTAVWTGTEMIVWGGLATDFSDSEPGTGGRYNPATDSWLPTSTEAAPTWRYSATAVWTGSEMVVWGGESGTGPYCADGGMYSPATDSWTPTADAGAPAARGLHTAVWTGSEMIVWGGIGSPDGWNIVYYNTGSRYDPAHDRWNEITMTGAPEARYYHTAVWTGTEMIVWGGYNADATDLNTGARYAPGREEHWTPVATIGAPTGRDSHSAVWTGSRMVIWGGYDIDGLSQSGGRYDPGTDSWQSVSAVGAPPATGSHSAVWTGSSMITWGGWLIYGMSHGGGRYDPSADSWTPVRTIWRPTARSRHAAVWTGAEMIVWGGYPGGVFPPNYLDAGRYDPATDAWSAISLAGAPTDRWEPSTVWTGSEMIIWGGSEFDPSVGSERATNGGGRYSPVLDQWGPVSTNGQPGRRMYHSTVWTGTEMIVWGGSNGTSSLGDGGRYRPAADAWAPTSTVGAPSPRKSHVAVWDGREMIVSEGVKEWPPMTDPGGGRYDPALDRWIPNSSSGAQPREGGNAVWSGREMIVAFGRDQNYQMNTGERYDPAKDMWTPIATCDTRLVAQRNGAVWACGLMAVWSDDSQDPLSGDGRLYDVGTDSWTAMSQVRSPIGCQNLRPVTDGTRVMTFGGSGYYGYESDSGGVYCACSSPAALSTPTILLDRTSDGDRVAVLIRPEASAYDVVRGDLGLLRSSHGDFAVATQLCLANDLEGSQAIDPSAPGAGQGFWYVARSVRGGEVSTYDSGAPRQLASRDAGIAASGRGCP